MTIQPADETTPNVSLPPRLFTALLVAILGLGIALRLGLYFRNRALWLDEAFLALNFLHRDYAGLAQPLEFRQGAPLAYLWLTKTIATVWGYHEYALRSISFLAGVAAFATVYLLGRRILDRASLLIALAICAVSAPLIRYSSELKQYSLDVLFAVVLPYAALSCLAKPSRGPKFIALGFFGILAPWFSHASAFVAAGIFSTTLVSMVWRRDRRSLIFFCSAFAAWALSFAINFMLVLRHTAEDKEVLSWWLSAYLPRPIYSISALKWICWSFTDMFSDPVGLVLPGLGAVAFITGAAYMAKKKPIELSLLIAPLGFAFLAAALHRYPFTGRFLLFVVPSLSLIIGVGVSTIATLLGSSNRIAAASFIVLLFAQPLMLAVNSVADEPPSGMRPVIEALRQERKPGEPLYLYHWSQFEFQYYAELNHYDPGEHVSGITSRNDWAYYSRELDAFRGRGRVWFVFNNVAPKLGEGEEKYFLNRLGEMGQKVAEHKWKNARLYCFSLDHK